MDTQRMAMFKNLMSSSYACPPQSNVESAAFDLRTHGDETCIALTTIEYGASL